MSDFLLAAHSLLPVLLAVAFLVLVALILDAHGGEW